MAGDALDPHELAQKWSDVAQDMFTGEYLPSEGVLSANAYFGAQPIKELLDTGCDIVITGRCVDSTLVSVLFVVGQKRHTMHAVKPILKRRTRVSPEEEEESNSRASWRGETHLF